MEGLIPLVYRAIVQYKNGEQLGVMDTWLNESPSASYVRLPTGDSGRFSTSDIGLFRPDCGFFACSPSHSDATRAVSTAIQSPRQRYVINSCRAVK